MLDHKLIVVASDAVLRYLTRIKLSPIIIRVFIGLCSREFISIPYYYYTNIEECPPSSES